MHRQPDDPLSDAADQYKEEEPVLGADQRLSGIVADDQQPGDESHAEQSDAGGRPKRRPGDEQDERPEAGMAGPKRRAGVVQPQETGGDDQQWPDVGDDSLTVDRVTGETDVPVRIPSF